MTSSLSAADTTAVETYGRWPLLYLLGSAASWLVVSGVLALIAGLQLHAPGAFNDVVLTHGHAQAMAESAFVYGWLAQAGLALALWILARLGGEPLRAANWIAFGGLFWNFALLLGLIGIGCGEGTAIPYLQMPAGVQPILVVAYGAMAVAGVLAWTGRRRSVMFASHWYAVAALFLFPWMAAIAQVMLLWFPVRGTLQAVVAGWYGQGVWTLWLAPLALASAFYLVPKSTGRTLPGYDFASLSFWCLLFVGAWTGGRHLIGGPVPAWISTVAIVASFTLLFHTIITAINFGPALKGGSVSLRLVGFGIAAYVLSGLLDAITSLHAVSAVTQFTYFDQAQTELALYGALSTILMGGIYYALPRLTGRSWAWGGLIRLHLGLVLLGIVVLVAALAGAGLVQGTDLADPAVSYAAIAAHTAPWLVAASFAQGLLLFGNVLFLFNLAKTAFCPYYAAAVAAFRPSAAAEVSAS